MNETSLNFLKTLLETPSPSGYEAKIQKVVREWAGKFADEVRTDRHGNVHCVKKVRNRGRAKPRNSCLRAIATRLPL